MEAIQYSRPEIPNDAMKAINKPSLLAWFAESGETLSVSNVYVLCKYIATLQLEWD